VTGDGGGSNLDDVGDDRLLDELRDLVVAADPAPPTLHAAARDAFGLSRLGEELLALVQDSNLETAGARGDDVPRLLSFADGEVAADLEVVPVGDAFEIRGVVEGTSGAVAVQTPGATLDTPLDAAGWFRGVRVTGRMMRLLLSTPSGRRLATSWVLLR
jgi:hypothetical protein